uniref:ATP synthase subunit a n=1 Tax=Ricinoides karschii TaxID=1238228 RepID=W5R4I7_9ARAC|nr:ATP synthase F0 subunit 6 [Ricinoides karschii]AGL11949.1 ATP synthase F0 subunit 6 [Ricinoides karschii]
MMINLFSTFDPSTSSHMSLNWLSLFLPILLIPTMYWKISSQTQNTTTSLYSYVYNEIMSMHIKGPKGFTLMLFSLMWIILIMNIMGLLPYSFTATSHLSTTVTLGFTLWLSINVFGWVINTRHMLTHMLPMGTPMALSTFMVCIETISNIIRPLTLAVRLSANMIAGHLLIVLLSSTLEKASYMIIFTIMPVDLMLMLLETGVALIQSYVFMTLLSLYLNETN